MNKLLFTNEQRQELLDNGKKSKHCIESDPFPVVKLFLPDGVCTWLLCELDPDDDDIAFGLCDLGLGDPELGTVSISELQRLRGTLGLPVERDVSFRPKYAISTYADLAIEVGRIIA